MNRLPVRLALSFYRIFFALLRFDNTSRRECNKFVKKICEVILETRQFSPTGLEPELNPLHNPVLAANLDQWARVYAAAPPEKRSQAIRQLLSELEDNKEAHLSKPQQVEVAGESSSHPTDFACWQCGRMNESGQMYCGFCGAETVPAQANPLQSQTDTNFAVRSQTQSRTADSDLPLPAFRAVQPSNMASRQLDSLRELSFSTIYDSQESSRNGWRYAIAVFVLLCCLGALGYVQWRTQIRAAWDRWAGTTSSQTQTASQSGQQNTPTTNDQNSQPPDTAASYAASSNSDNNNAPLTSAAPVAPEPGKPTSTAGSQSALNQNLAKTAEDATARTTTKPADRAQEDQAQADDEETAAANPPASRTKSANAVTPASNLVHENASATGSSSQNLADNGSAELATAKEYLDGTSGARNPSQAASWLWKAVGKKNPEALVLLSGLYLHGDGVPKNCDQARLLLVAAAKKGAPNAGAQLRTFESSGCR